MATNVNPRAITAVKLSFEAGYKAAKLGKPCVCSTKNPLIRAAFHRGFDLFVKEKK